ncbi:MAG: hypothetical protein F9K09_01455 [Flavobacteriales bacterium]|nr:MAG: hypothetical protein F9K09_01455 [Flavobacteriales bacterium]
MSNITKYISKTVLTIVVLLIFFNTKAQVVPPIQGNMSPLPGAEEIYYINLGSAGYTCSLFWDIPSGNGVIIDPVGGITGTTSGISYVRVKWDCNPGAIMIRARENPYGWCDDGDDFDKSLSGIIQNFTPIASPTIDGLDEPCIGGNYIYNNNYGLNTKSNFWVVSNGDVIFGQGTQNANIQFNATGSQTVAVVPITIHGCEGTPIFKQVNVKSPLTLDFNNPVNDVCGGDIETYQVTYDADASGYTWNLPVGVNVISGSGTNTVTLEFDPYAQSGPITVTSMYACGTGFTTSTNVNVTVKPFPPSTIQGAIAVCQGTTTTYGIEAIGNLNPGANPGDDYYTWEVTGGTPATYTTTVPQLEVTWTDPGIGTVTVTPHNECGNSPTSSTINVIVHPNSTSTIVDNIEYNHSKLQSQIPDYLVFNHCQTSNNCSNKVIDKATLMLNFNTGDDYNYGLNAFSTSVKVQIIGYAGINNSGAHVIDKIVDLAINQASPEQFFQLDFSNEYYQVQSFEIKILAYNGNALVQNTIQLTAEYIEEFKYNALTATPLVSTVSALPVVGGSNQYEFTWTNTYNSCTDFPNYEIQILRLFNSDPDPSNYVADINWEEALTIETQSSEKSIKLTLAEGTGYYVWRVRPIGNFEGGVGNDKNWGLWSNHPGYEQGSVSVSGGSSYLFHYDQFNEVINWIYSRTFTEGNIENNQQVRIGENITFANGLQQVKQTQAHLSTNDNILTTQTVNDYSGRPALSTMPVPLKNKTSLGFEPNFMKKDATNAYTAKDFDADLNFNIPSAVYDATGSHFDYYSNANTDVTIPSAESFPFTRTLFYNDGNSRVKEQSGVGETFKIKADPTTSKTNKTYYAGVADEELIRVFGDEAPLNTSVHKVINVDGNNTASVTYIGKDGKTLATCLATNGKNKYGEDVDALMGLQSQQVAGFPVLDIIDNTTPYGDYGNQATTTRTFVEETPTTVNIHYDLTPKSIEDICLNYCATCDYYVEIIVQNIEDPANYVYYREELLPSGICGGTITPFVIDDQVVLPKGTYIFTKRVVANNTDPSTITPTNTIGSTYFEKQVQQIRTSYEDQIYGTTGALATINAFLDAGDIDGLYLSLGVVDLNNPPESVSIPIGCSTIDIPVILCPKKECPPATGANFAAYFDNFWAEKNYIFQNIQLDGYTNASFDALIQNMDGIGNYDCEKLWDCWYSLVQNYEDVNKIYTSKNLPLPFNIVDAFLDCTGINITSITTDSQFALEHAYETFLYTPGQSPACENYFENDPSGCTIANFGNCSNLDLMNNFYECVTNADPNPLTPEAQTDPYLAAQAMTDTCELYCEYKRAGFISSIIEAFHQNQQYVAANPNPTDPFYPYSGDIYQLEYVGDVNGAEPGGVINQYQFNDLLLLPEGTVFVAWEEILCMAEALVKNCKKGCAITPVFDGNNNLVSVGTPEELQAYEKAFAWAYEVSLPDSEGSCGYGWSTISKTENIVRDSIFISSTPIVDGVENIYELITTTTTIQGGIEEVCIIGNHITESITGCGSPTGCQSMFTTVLIPETCDIYDATWCNDEWQRHFGGHQREQVNAFEKTSDGGYLIVGNTLTHDGSGDVINQNYGGQDAWVIKLDNNLNILWEKSYGGSLDDELMDFAENSSGEYILVGHSKSNDRDLSENMGDFDYWVLKIKNDGSIVWSNSYGSNKIEKLNSIALKYLEDGFYGVGSNTDVAAPFSIRASSILFGPSGGLDYSNINVNNQAGELNAVVRSEFPFKVAVGYLAPNKTCHSVEKFQSVGINTIVNYSYPEPTQFAKDIHYLNLGSNKYIMTGYTNKNDANFITHGNGDYTAMLLDESLQKIWSKTYGGENEEVVGLSTSLNEAGFIITGSTKSTNGDVIQSGQFWNHWFIHLDWNGNEIESHVIEKNSINSSDYIREYGVKTLMTNDGCYLVIGNTSINNNIGSEGDIVLTKYCPNECCVHRDFCFRYVPWPTIPEDAPEVLPITCEESAAKDIRNAIEYGVYEYVEAQVEAFKNSYEETCVNPENIDDHFWLTYPLGYHHYTLYYYNRAGNLIQTVPPQGVDLLDIDNTNDAFDNVGMNRNTSPNHRFVTDYEYNSLGQLVKQITPDGGATYFYYNKLGQLRFSQNEKQLGDGTNPSYSYTKYDKLGRIIEVGESTQAAMAGDFQNNVNVVDFPTPPAGDPIQNSQVTYTVYTDLAPNISYLNDALTFQEHLQNRVSYTYTDEDGDVITTKNDQTYTYYSYDPHGNVEWLVQDIPGFLDKQYIRYEYDLVSGNVLKVSYNEGRMDQFYHRYTYDADNRIILAETSKNNITWDKDAGYEYYAHGPLKRTEIGEDHIQGLDYIYTIHGWLKALNHASLDKTLDPGHDGTNATNNFAKDVFAMQLGYFTGDFNRSSSPFNSANLSALNPANNRNLYNGNISTWSTNNMAHPNSLGVDPYPGLTGYQYRYDELNRIKTADFKENVSLAGFSGNLSAYSTNYSYDANGNLYQLNRNGKPSNLGMDNLAYHYYNQAGGVYDGTTQFPEKPTNKLAYVSDGPSTYNDDIDNQAIGNYSYDEIGNLITDASEEIDEIKWTVYGKIKEIIRTSGSSKPNLKFIYDASGNRIAKIVIPNAADASQNTITWYSRDASGNVMAVYESEFEPTPNGLREKIYLSEEPIYGSSRIGEYKKKTLLKIIDEPTIGLPTENFANLNAKITESTNMLIGVQKPFTITHTLGLLAYLTPKAGGKQEVNYSAPSSPQVSGVNSQIGFGVQGKNLCVVEDENGNVVFSAYTAKELAGGTATNVCRILDANNNLMNISLSYPIKSNYEGKSLGIKKPGSTNIYYLITIGTDLRPYYHEINTTTKQVSPNHLIDAVGTNYGYGMALIEDNSGIASSKLYLRKYNSNSTVDIVSIAITQAGFGPPVIEQNFACKDANGKGEIQVSPDCTKLAIAYQKSNLGWWAADGKIRVYNLDLNHNITGLSVEHNAGSRSSLQSFDFSPSSKNIYYSQVEVGKVVMGGPANTKGIYKLDLVTNNSTEIIPNVIGEVRRVKDNNMYVAIDAEANLQKISNPDGAPSVSSFALASAPWKTTGAIPLQPHKILHLDIDILARELNNKTYEINDHLGNVRAVVSDLKESTITAGVPTNFTPDIVAINNYYAGGSIMPGRSFSSNSYRYGAFGFEKDDEVKGSGNHYSFSDYGYDPRLIKRWQIDPQTKAYPWQSPYSAFNNNPIFYVDPTGESGVAYKTDKTNKDGKPILRVVSNIYIYGEGASQGAADAIQAEVSSQYNNGGQFFTTTVDGTEYEVQFEFTTKIIDGKDVDSKLVEGGYGNLNAENNFYEIVNTPKNPDDVGVTFTSERAGSEGGNTGFIKASEVVTPTVSHEINHGFGGENKDTKTAMPTTDNDIAVQGKNSSNPECRCVTQGNINAIFKNVSFNGGDKANVGNPRPQLYDNNTGGSRQVTPK